MGYTQENEKKRIIDDAAANEVQFIDLEFIDVPGTSKMTEIPVARLGEALEHGMWFDGSSIEGFVGISESDMFLVPDPATYSVVPWTEGYARTARLICDVYTANNQPFDGDPRNVLKQQLAKASEKGYSLFTGPELEFFIFKSQNGDPLTPETASVHDNAGYFETPTRDAAIELRRQIVPALEAMGLTVEMAHHEVAPGQQEIDFKYAAALTSADWIMTYKNVVRTIAQSMSLHASFMPKPIAGINGSGMHVHQSLWKGGQNIFADENDKMGLSQEAYYYIAGILSHAQALAAVTNPIVNSYKRLVPGYEAPVYVAWGRSNRSALVRIPRIRAGEPKATRCEVRFPDPSCNPYLAFAAMLAAGMDGIAKKTSLPAAQEDNLYHLTPAQLKERNISTLPGSLKEAMDALASDDVVKKALGPHIYPQLTEWQTRDWNAYRTSVSDWEKNRYFGVI